MGVVYIVFEPSVHIVFNCEEEDRIIKPILDNKPSKIYYFTAIIRQTGQKDVYMEYFNKNRALLEQEIPHIKIIQKEVDYTNYIEVIQELSKIINQERESNPLSKIYINVSSGSKMTSNASVEASKLWNANIYYVFSTQYDPVGNGPRHKGEMIIKTPITFPINKPNDEIIKVIKFIELCIENKYKDKEFEIKEKFISKKDLIEKMKNEGYLTLQKKNKDARKEKSSMYMNFNQKFVKILADELKYIEISSDKRNKKVSLTSAGKQVCEIFRYLV